MANLKNKRIVSVLVVIIVLVAILAIVGGIALNEYLAKLSYPLEHVSLIKKYAREYDLDTYMVAGVIHTESRFREDAVSRVGAMGLMQVMPDTGDWIAGKLKISDYNVEMLSDPDTNIRFGCWYLRFLLDRFNPDTAIAAYNAGHGKVAEWLENPEYSANGKDLVEIPFRETDQYVTRVLEAMEKYKKLYSDEL